MKKRIFWHTVLCWVVLLMVVNSYGQGDTLVQETLALAGDEVKDPIEVQDGVAPQCKIDGLSKERRVFIPVEDRKKNKQEEKLGFKASHSIINYEWIFDKK